METHTPSVTIIIFLTLLALAASTGPKNVRVFAVEKDPGSGRIGSDVVRVNVDLGRSLNIISSHFVGVTIDAGQVHLNWSTLNFSSLRVQNMGRALSPSYFRLGGTSADTMTYELGTDVHAPRVESDVNSKHPKFNLTAKNWDAVNGFSQAVGWEFIMDLNALKRNPDGSWNPDNARQLLQYSSLKNFSIAGFELGNEYELYKRFFNVSVSPSQLAKDVSSLRELLAQFPAYSTAFVIGPETAGVDDYFSGFLAAGGSKVVRAASFHQYYFGEKGSHVSDFINVTRMNELVTSLDEVVGMTQSVDPLLPVWLSETSSSYNSGTPNISDRFVAGFLWLDKLGVCASKGVQTVIRQAFYGGHYSLVNAQLNPNPDFWLTVLFKQIVRGAVFNATTEGDVIRVYAACANPQYYKLGSVALYMLNPNPYPVNLDLIQFRGQQLRVYALTAGDDKGLLSKYTSLNGEKLELVNDQLPELVAKEMTGNILMDLYSFMFIVVPDARATICMEHL